MHLASIHVYPLKSAAGLSLDEAQLQVQGFQGDRRWMVVDEDCVFISQRNEPRMALLDVALDGQGLKVTAGGYGEVHVTLPKDAERRVVQVWDDEVEGSVATELANDWISEYVGKSCRFIYLDDPKRRSVDPAYGQPGDVVSFADAYPLLIASTASLQALNDRLNDPLPMNRFRPNLVIDGADPFAEDGWQEIRIGDVRVELVKGCARCAVTTIDQRTAERGKEPLKTLADFRKRDGKVYFGQNAIPRSTGRVRVGDAIELVTDASEALAASRQETK